MLHIITGAIDGGKTRKMLSIYNRLKRGDGFISQKVFHDQKGFVGYEIRRLSTGQKLLLAVKETHLPRDWEDIYRIGPYHFSKKAFIFAENIISEIIASNIEPVFIDEIGPLELKGEGFSSLLERVLEASAEVYIAVRSHCVEEVINKFNIGEYITLTV